MTSTSPTRSRRSPGPRTLAELYDGRSQLLVYHFTLGRTRQRAVRAAPSPLHRLDRPRPPRRWNFRPTGSAGVDAIRVHELMALSAFALEDCVVCHTYTCCDRGTDALITTGPAVQARGAVEALIEAAGR